MLDLTGHCGLFSPRLFARRRVQLWALVLAIFLALTIRILFLLEYPYAFGHPDSPHYLDTVAAMLRGQPYVPHVLRVNATYAFFSYFVLKLLGIDSWNIIVAQSLLGILGGVLSFLIVRRLTGSWYFGLLVLLVVSLRVRALFYEHILLVESLYDFLGLLFCWTCLEVISTPTIPRLATLSAVTIALIFARGQGWVFLAAEVAVPAMLLKMKAISVKRAGSFLLISLLPLLLVAHAYISLNRKYHHFSSISAAGTYNLFWIATPRYFDFRSTRGQDVKKALEPCIRDANQNYANDLAWGTPGPICAPIVDRLTNDYFGATLQANWQLIDQEMGGLSGEAVRAHPIECFYRFLWNVADFLFFRSSVSSTIDLTDLLLARDRGRLRIDPAKALAARSMDPLTTSRMDSRAGSKADTALRSSGRLSLFTDIVGLLSGFVLNPLLVVLVAFSIFIAICNRTSNMSSLAILFLIWAGQIGLTVAATNALYDRYYLLPEALGAILIVVGLSYFTGLRRRAKVWNLCSFVGLVFLIVVGFFVSRECFKRSIPILDGPVLGLSISDAVRYQSTVMSFLLSSAFLILGLLLVRARLRSFDSIQTQVAADSGG